MNKSQCNTEVILISHHLDDIESSLKKGDVNYALEAVKDAKEAIKRLSSIVSNRTQEEVKRIEEDILAIADSFDIFG